MESYHSKFNSTEADLACNIPLLPVQTKDAYSNDTSAHDIVDEAIALFRANIFFKNYKVEGPADRTLVFLTCFIQKMLEQMARFPEQEKAARVVGLIMAEPSILDVQSANHFMNKLGLLKVNPTISEKQKCAEYLKTLMRECSKRLLEYLYRPEEGEMNRKFWLGFGKKTFLGQKFVDKQF